MLSGKYPHTHRMWNNNDMMQWAIRDLPDEVELISQPLSRAGYQCGYAGKWHCGREKVPSAYGFQGMDVPDYGNPYETEEYKNYLKEKGLKQPDTHVLIQDPSDKSTIAGEVLGDIRATATYFLADYVIEMIKRFEEIRKQTGKPWFIFLSYWSPHHPYVPPHEYYKMYDPKEIELWPNFKDTLKDKPQCHKKFRERCYQLTKISDNKWQEIIAHAFAQTTFLDSQIGRVLSNLDELEISKQTAVLFSTDHGDMCGSHGGFFDKGPFMYEETYHIPLIIRWPGVTKAGTISDEFVLNMDLAPTILGIAGIAIPDDYEARSMVPLLQDNTKGWPDEVTAEFHGHRFLSSHRMVRWSRYKYVFNPLGLDEFYNLEEDPYELKNLINDLTVKDIVKEGRDRLLHWMRRTQDGLLKVTKRFLPM